MKLSYASYVITLLSPGKTAASNLSRAHRQLRSLQEDGALDVDSSMSFAYFSAQDDDGDDDDESGKSKSGKSSKTVCRDSFLLDAKAESSFYEEEPNPCSGTTINIPDEECDEYTRPQSGANITEGYVGGLDHPSVPYTEPFYQSAMCPINVRWHLGTEHYSVDEYDEGGDGPNGNQVLPEWATRDLAESDDNDDDDENVRGGFRCHHYDEADEKFTKEFDWKHCKDMEVGETYEVHWTHSAGGDCGTVHQYQTPFLDGIFCNAERLDLTVLTSQVGIQGQVFTVVNDEAYFYPDLMRGMIVTVDGEHGHDVAIYTGSTTGSSRSNEDCSSYTPITWQVDRKCHMISASSFDKMCYDMKMQRDDMSGDLHAHGSRELVHDKYVANNQYDKATRE
mmetsp:Transcript_27591/g.62793  ORF Transcript_27591/g.62793 Transcript_27591/m.62793 type:complete len:394 (+) Transcript_27591:109-1290(+)